jgi:hypothetical protein
VILLTEAARGAWLDVRAVLPVGDWSARSALQSAVIADGCPIRYNTVDLSPPEPLSVDVPTQRPSKPVVTAL